MMVLIVMWYVADVSCRDARQCMKSSTAVTMQEFSSPAKCEAARKFITGISSELSATCIPK